ncbi:MFS transporter [Nostoc sp. WHI]|uniref:MFS transporter n=1 Tax=Nostoc sp. WHI TaxID=2650611 RepID=UPI0018C6E952|nr:MFS transporter [Nostoc sp. WHI]MBG1270223.1 MFS transporter [Nostoc sp. WHI]
MRNFTIIWLGQIISTIGSYMTSFAITIWLWEQTNQVTTLALLGFFTFLPSIFMTLVAGLIIDHANRKFLMMIADTVAAVSTVIILCLYLTDNLQIWHFYVSSAVNAAFSEIQELAYSATMSTLVSKKHYTRATTMNSALHYSSITIAPALSGFLYPLIDFSGILIIDLLSFVVAITILLKIPIYQPKFSDRNLKDQDHKGFFWQITFGFRYLLTRPSLLAMTITGALFWFFHDIGRTLYAPMILARTGNDATALGSISSAAGIGGVIGASLLSIWGGFQPRIHGFLLGMVGAGVSKTIFGLAQGLQIWLPAQFFSSVNFPLLISSNTSILLTKVKPYDQGRVFATLSTIQQCVSAIAILIAGSLADKVFQPAMMPGGHLMPLFGWLVGTGSGSGIALLYTISSLGLLMIGLGGYAINNLRDVEILLSDYDEEEVYQEKR